MRKTELVYRYAFFALISIAANFFTQEICTRLGSIKPFSILVEFLASFIMSGQNIIFYGSMAAGTLVGLLTKYILDKKYIFFHGTESIKEDVGKFGLYSAMGIVTTAIFWGFETTFYYISDTYYAKYLGAAIGLVIGYMVKYYLDKKFVFKKQSAV